MFSASLVPALPNYINISHLDTVCPYCTPKFNFAVESALQDIVGIGCAAVFATKLLPVLLVVMPSIVRACSMILIVEASANKTYTSTMASVQHAVAISTIMTPLVTAIPTIVGFQILRRYGQQTFTAMVLAVFYAVPTLLGFMRPKRPLVIELRLVVYSLFYFIPLIIIGLYEGHRFDFMRKIIAQLKDPMTYVELACEVCLANVILSDMILSCVYVYEKNLSSRKDLIKVVVVPCCFLISCTFIIVAVWWPLPLPSPTDPCAWGDPVSGHYLLGYPPSLGGGAWVGPSTWPYDTTKLVAAKAWCCQHQDCGGITGTVLMDGVYRYEVRAGRSPIADPKGPHETSWVRSHSAGGVLRSACRLLPGQPVGYRLACTAAKNETACRVLNWTCTWSSGQSD
jgi:hypothetical protein